MTFQNLMIDILRIAPKGLVRYLAGTPVIIDGNSLDPNMQIILNSSPQEQQLNLVSPNQFRKVAKQLDKIALPNIKGVTVKDEEIISTIGKLKIRTYQKDVSQKDSPAILFFHQGGLVIMDNKTDDYFCSLLAQKCNPKVISLDYRRCPEDKFPAAFEDAFALWDYAQLHSDKLGINPKSIVLAGDSAGGMISASMAIDLRDRGGIQPSALCLLYPWVTTSIENQPSIESCKDIFPLTFETMEFFRNTVFINGENLEHPWANPLNEKDLTNLPPTIIATAGFDPIRDQGIEFSEALKKDGVEVIDYCFKHLPHSFLIFGRISKAIQEANNRIANDLAKTIENTK